MAGAIHYKEIPAGPFRDRITKETLRYLADNGDTGVVIVSIKLMNDNPEVVFNSDAGQGILELIFDDDGTVKVREL